MSWSCWLLQGSCHIASDASAALPALQYTEQLYGTVFGPYGFFRLRENGAAGWLLRLVNQRLAQQLGPG